jgi:hypothetical protein
MRKRAGAAGICTAAASFLAKPASAAAVFLQALSYSHGSKTRYLVRLQLHEPASCSLPALLQLKEGKAAAAAVAVRAVLTDATSDQAECKQHAAAGSSHGSYESGAGRGDCAGSVEDNTAKAQQEQEPL